MANYLALIRKADFIDLFKYGCFHINRDMVQEFTCAVENLPQEKRIFDDIVKNANNFDSSFTYLFIHYEKDSENIADINIADVRNIYPLDQEAKVEFSISFDPRIKIQEPLWPSAVREWQKQQTIEGCKKGADNIWKIYDIKEPIEEARKIITDDILKEFVEELYDNRLPSGELPIWVYVLRYERHAPYYDDTRGAFMDTTNAIMNYMKKQEVDYSIIENTQIMHFFQNSTVLNFQDILTLMDKTPEIKKFLDYTIEIVPDYDLIKIATLFYIFRRQYIEGFKNEETWKVLGNKYSKEFAVSCYMLGCTLGYEHTYDCLYDELPLAIFKPKSPTPTKAIEKINTEAKPVKQKENSTSNSDKNKQPKGKTAQRKEKVKTDKAEEQKVKVTTDNKTGDAEQLKIF